MRRLAVVLAGAALAATACAGPSGPSGLAGSASAGPAGGAARVVATTTMLGSVTSDITACAGGTTTTLMPPGADPHDFAASSKQVTAMVKADLVVANGLGLEGGMADVLANARTDGAHVVELGEEIDPLPLGEHDEPDEHGSHAGHDHGSQDPHFWLDPTRMAKAATVIGDRLSERTGRTQYASCGREVATRLTALAAQMRQDLAVIPAERRVLVTDHDAFGYFAEAFGFEVVGVVIPGGSTQAEPSSAELGALVGTLQQHRVRALFSNAAASPRLVEQVARETGTDVRVVALYVGSVGTGEAATYEGMMRANTRAVVDALTA